MAELTRRRLLGRAAAAGAAGVGASLLPRSVQKALADAPAPGRPGRLGDIGHIVMLMQENRSFDHYFGTLSGVRGFDDPAAVTLGTGRSVFHQPDAVHPDGYLLPFHLDTLSSSAQAIPSTSHTWSVHHQAWNGGRMDGWLAAHREADAANGPYVMGYYTRRDIPFHYALADAFTICDNYHCSVMGPTWPNRLYWMTGTCDPDGRNGGPVTGNAAPPGGFTWTTYAERLEAAGVSWKVYAEQDDYGCNMLKNFRSFQQAPAESPLHRKGLAPGPRGSFEYDAVNDRLPQVSWIICTSTESEHPDGTPAAGAAYVASKIGAIAANPEVWAKTLFILTYDENDGLFDHVVPPTAPPGTPGEYVAGQPVGGGFRVPCILVSPWTAGGWVAGERFDHTSCIRLLERWTGVAEPNIGDWRRATFGDLTSALRMTGDPAGAPVLPDTAGPLTLAGYEASRLPAPALPGGGQTVPHQEPGQRPYTPGS
ncbi:alkaline phosphatase family protein [Streptomyces sp. NPDC020983]|uniref:alkaline phosphatase family protein n=1 Tax=Streptomyces sp. NPDC020983 TaxID=3365106 RepID=UPI00378DA4D9